MHYNTNIVITMHAFSENYEYLSLSANEFMLQPSDSQLCFLARLQRY